MKYQYKKSAVYYQWIATIIFAVFLLWLYYTTGCSKKSLIEKSVGVFTINFVLMIKFYREMINRCVELQDTFIRFNSFRLSSISMKNTASINVKYEHISNIKSKRLPVIGVWAVVIEAKNLPQTITVSFCFAKHKELTERLCELVKQYNPNAYIDERLLDYCKE